MKKITLLISMAFTLSFFVKAQIIVEDFESPADTLKMNLMAGGAEDSSSFTVMVNPFKTGINTSNTVCQLLRDKDGVPWEGFWSATEVDVTDFKFVHVKVYKPRISTIKFKLEGGAGGNLEIASMYPQTKVDDWEDVVFDFRSKTGKIPVISFMPDFSDPVALDSDINLYFDDIIINNDSLPIGYRKPGLVEDFETPEDTIKMNLMAGGAEDLSSFTVMVNPFKTGINTSNTVCQLLRDKDGVPWEGFWSATEVDVTDSKFVHVKVYKSRISTVKFKLEGGAGGNLEIASMYPQTKVNEWEDMVFDFRSKTGKIPVISFMPDFSDPVNLDGDIELYFDDIMINNDSIPEGGLPSVNGIDIDKVSDILIYPNPIGDNLTVNNISSLSKIIISSIDGKQLQTFIANTAETVIPFNDYKAGIYLITIINQEGTVMTKKLLKR